MESANSKRGDPPGPRTNCHGLPASAGSLLAAGGKWAWARRGRARAGGSCGWAVETSRGLPGTTGGPDLV